MAKVADLISLGFNHRQAAALGSISDDGIAATGTTQGTAFPLIANINRVNSATGGSADGILLPVISATLFDWIVVRNDSSATLNIYPGTGEFINLLAANTAITLAANNALVFFKCDELNARWVTR